MGIGKMLGLAALGVGAVALAPFTGGGSVAGAATLGASLLGAEAAAAGVAAVGAGVGYAMSRKEEEEEERRQREREEMQEENARLNLKAKKYEDIIKAHKGHTEYILALSALGISMANADGEISKEEKKELDEFVGGLAAAKYPQHITKRINDMIKNPLTLNEAFEYLNRVEINDFKSIRDILVLIMEADGYRHIKEEAYLQAFDEKIKELN